MIKNSTFLSFIFFKILSKLMFTIDKIFPLELVSVYPVNSVFFKSKEFIKFTTLLSPPKSLEDLDSS